MKKLFLLFAFTGIVGASSAVTVAALTKGTVIALGGEEKKDEKKKCDKKKACCKKDETAAASTTSDGKAEVKSCHGGETKGKACCKGKAEAKADVVPAATPAK